MKTIVSGIVLRRQVHGGFFWAYDSLRAPLLEAVGTLMSDGASEPWRVLATGHSLGAGLATLFAYELACSWWVMTWLA